MGFDNEVDQKRPRGPLRRTIVMIEEPTEALTTPNVQWRSRACSAPDYLACVTRCVTDGAPQAPPRPGRTALTDDSVIG